MAAYDNIPDNYVTPTNREVSSSEYAGILKELSPDKKVIHLIKELQGKVYDPSKSRYIEIEGASPIMNEKGINAFLHQATSVMNSIVTMSNFRKEVDLIHKLVMMQVKRASKHFHLYWKEYGMESSFMAQVVTDKLMILAISAYYKAIGAGDRKAGTQNISESFQTLQRDDSQNPQRNRQGFLSRFMPGVAK